MFWIFCAVLFAIGAIFAPSIVERLNSSRRRYRDEEENQGTAMGWMTQVILRGTLILLVFFSIAATSYVTIGQNEVGHLTRVYLGESLPAGRIIALDGQKGPQAEILGPGFHFRLLLNVLYDVDELPVTEIPDGYYGKLIARDGISLPPGQAFADQFGDLDTMLNAETFLASGGQKGPQVMVLTPGRWRLNSYLWDVQTISQDGEDFGTSVTEIQKGFVGVIKSNVYADVNFGEMRAAKPKSCKPTQEEDLSGGKLAVPLVPIGCIGIWDRPLLPGRYYLNRDAYTVVLMDTRVQSWEFKGGFTRRSIALEVDQKGKITQKETTQEEPVQPEYADRAVFLKVEGWDVPQELRVLVQIPPDNAPIVVASVGGEKEVEHRIIVPAVRAIVRDVTGGGYMEFPKTNEQGEPVLDEQGKTLMVRRAPQVLDLLNNRSLLEAEILRVIKPEGHKAGVEIKEIRFGEPSVPPELLVARLREQLAQQLSASYREEQTAQGERIKTENSRAMADQQDNLVQAAIEQEKAVMLKEAAKLAGEGERAKLLAVAEGQKAQAAVLGEERVAELRKYELFVDRLFSLIEENPELITTAITNASKFVPDTVITTGEGAGLEGAASIFGTLLRQTEGKQEAQGQ